MDEVTDVGGVTADQADEIIRLLSKIDADAVARHAQYIERANTMQEIALYLLGVAVIALAGLLLISFLAGWRSAR